MCRASVTIAVRPSAVSGRPGTLRATSATSERQPGRNRRGPRQPPAPQLGHPLEGSTEPGREAVAFPALDAGLGPWRRAHTPFLSAGLVQGQRRRGSSGENAHPPLCRRGPVRGPQRCSSQVKRFLSQVQPPRHLGPHGTGTARRGKTGALDASPGNVSRPGALAPAGSSQGPCESHSRCHRESPVWGRSVHSVLSPRWADVTLQRSQVFPLTRHSPGARSGPALGSTGGRRAGDRSQGACHQETAGDINVPPHGCCLRERGTLTVSAWLRSDGRHRNSWPPFSPLTSCPVPGSLLPPASVPPAGERVTPTHPTPMSVHGSCPLSRTRRPTPTRTRAHSES